MRCARAFTHEEQQKGHYQVLVVVSLEGNAKKFQPVCDSEVVVEDIGTCAVELRRVKALVGSPNC